MGTSLLFEGDPQAQFLSGKQAGVGAAGCIAGQHRRLWVQLCPEASWGLLTARGRGEESNPSS